jgi:hypothetical protein
VADQPDHAGFQAQRHAVDRGDILEGFGDVLQFQHGGAPQTNDGVTLRGGRGAGAANATGCAFGGLDGSPGR